MKGRTILNVLIALLLCASGFTTVALAQDEQAPEIGHTVTIGVDTNEDNNEELKITMALEWAYPASLRTMADLDEDGAVSADEELDFVGSLSSSALNELQETHKSHVWTMSPGEDAVWNIEASASNVEGSADASDSFTVSLTLNTSVNEIVLQNDELTLTFGPIEDKDGGVSTPSYNTTVMMADGDYCTSSVDMNGTAQTSPFTIKSTETSDFTVVFSEAACGPDDSDKGDDDRDGVLNVNDQCPNTAEEDVDNVMSNGCVDDSGCVEGTDTDGDGVDDCSDTCPSEEGAVVDEYGCSEETEPDWVFNVTFTVDQASFECTGMTNSSTAKDCMDATNADVSTGSSVAVGHPHYWSWELQQNGMALTSQDPADLSLNSQSTFAWVVSGCSGDCQDKTVHTVTELTGTLDIASGDCVYFDGVSPTFGDDWDSAGQSSRCFSAEGTFTSGEFTITVGATANNNTTTEPIGNSSVVEEESTPGFGLIAGVSAALGAALIATSRRED